MKHIREFVDERQKAWCIHCGRCVSDTKMSRDHVPSKVLLVEPFPKSLPVVDVCQSCNAGFSLDEEYLAAFLGAVISGSTEPQSQVDPNVTRIFERKPELRARIEVSRSTYQAGSGETRSVWTPESERVNRVILKNARGHVFFEMGESVLDPPKYVRSAPLDLLTQQHRARFEAINLGSGWPEVGSRMLTRVLTGDDLVDGWVVVQDGIYRYAVTQTDGVLVRTVLREYLATEVAW